MCRVRRKPGAPRNYLQFVPLAGLAGRWNERTDRRTAEKKGNYSATGSHDTPFRYIRRRLDAKMASRKYAK